MITCGFYNSINHDRCYDALQMSSMFDGIISDGVFENVGKKFYVSPGANSALSVVVDTGRAWFNHTWTLNDNQLVLSIPTPNQTFGRIDAVVLEVNSSIDVRANSIKIVSGEPASDPKRPTLINSDSVHQYALAYISVSARAAEITQNDIENMVGTTDTPFVMGYANATGGYIFVRYLTASDDLNSLKSIGMYCYEADNIPHNAFYQAPSVLEIVGADGAPSSGVVQRITRNDKSGLSAWRSLSGNKWSAWAEIVTKNDLPTSIDGVPFTGGSNLVTPSYKYQRKLTASDDLDAVTTFGVYWYGADDIPKNSPYENPAVVEVQGGGTNFFQRVTRSGVTGRSAWRVHNSSGWTDWSEIVVSTLGSDIVMRYRKVLTDSDNLNSTTLDYGFYIFYTTSIPKNSPYQNASVVEIIGGEDDTILQRVTRVGVAGKSSWRVHTRDTGWSDWTEILTNLNGDTMMTYRGLLTSSDDLNSVNLQAGIHLYNTGDIPKNSPYEQASFVEIVATGGTSILQRVTRVGVAGKSSWRVHNTVGWTDWTEILTSDDKDPLLENVLTFRRTLTVNDDLNSKDLLVGIYYYAAASAPSNAPWPSNSAFVEITRSATGGSGVQRAWRISMTGVSAFRAYGTSSNVVSWTDWAYPLTDKDVDINAVVTFRGVLTSSDDLNSTSFKSGIYFYNSGEVPSNAPYPNPAIVEISTNGGASIIQRVTRTGVAGASSFRAHSSSGWTNWRTLADMESITIAAGDTVTISNAMLFGYITNTSKSLYLSVPLGKIITAPNVSVTALTAVVRGAKGYVGTTDSTAINWLQNATVTGTVKANGGSVTIAIVRTSAIDSDTAVVNNSPVVMIASTLTLKFS